MKKIKRTFFVVVLLSSAVLAALLLCQGCTFHFKGEKLEVDMERQRVETNATYHLESVDILRGSGS